MLLSGVGTTCDWSTFNRTTFRDRLYESLGTRLFLRQVAALDAHAS